MQKTSVKETGIATRDSLLFGDISVDAIGIFG
jgi:hypothetical protein